MTPKQVAGLRYTWRANARPEQLAPEGPWRWWVVQAGRGFGKTRAGAEWVREKVAAMPGSFGALVGQTPDEVRRVLVDGPAGIMAVTPESERPSWEPSIGLLRWPNGSKASVYSGANPEMLRGPQHHWAWCDEFAKFRKARETFDQLNMGLRLEGAKGEQPQCLFTTTPRPIAVFREIISKKNTVITRGTTYENRANLAASFFSELQETYEGTRIGRQELKGELLDDVPGSIWKRAMFDVPGFRRHRELEDFELISVAIDPAASNTETSDETGIVVTGSWHEGERRMFHVLADVSIYGSASERAHAAIQAFQSFEADMLVVETNNGGDWIPTVLQAEWEAMELPGAAPFEVVTASRGKKTRAEPISMLYEKSKVTHEPGLETLEDQLVTWSPLLGEASPDRMDALVWGLTWHSTAKRFVGT
jgi:phage terminase large subunit-like protein